MDTVPMLSQTTATPVGPRTRLLQAVTLCSVLLMAAVLVVGGVGSDSRIVFQRVSVALGATRAVPQVLPPLHPPILKAEQPHRHSSDGLASHQRDTASLDQREIEQRLVTPPSQSSDAGASASRIFAFELVCIASLSAFAGWLLRPKRPIAMAATVGEKDPAPQASGLPPWLPSFSVAAIGGCLFGYDIGGASSVLRVLGSGATDLGPLDPLQLGWLASGSLVGAVVASALLIALGDRQIGRKTELQAAAALYFAGTAIQTLAPSLPLVLAGRVVYGLGIGTAMHVAPLYIAESVPSEQRGQLVSLKEAAIVAGIVLGYLSGAVLSASGDWRSVFGAAVLLELPMAALSLTAPESARWLVLRGRTADAEVALTQAQGLSPETARAEVAAMQSMAAGADTADEGLGAKLAELTGSPQACAACVPTPPRMSTCAIGAYGADWSDSNRKALTIGVGLVLFQQLSGQPSVLYYANRIFESAGLGFQAAVGVGVFKLIMTLVSVRLVEDPRWGRRPLLLYGTAGMTLSLFALSALFALGGAAGPSQGLVIACVVAFVGCYQVGFGPVTWLILSEVFPLKIRSAAVSVGTLANFGSNFLVALLFDLERTNLGEGLLFGQFALIALAAVAFINAQVPETRGLTLEEIEAQIMGDAEADAESQS